MATKNTGPDEPSAPSTNTVVTLQDVADRCGVSRMTVSLALRNKQHQVSKQTIERVTAVAREMGYDPSHHQAARRLVMGRHGQEVLNHVVALFFPRQFYHDTYSNRILRGILDELETHKYGLLLNYAYSSTDEALLPSFRQGDVDGALTISFPESFASVLQQLRSEVNFARRPVVNMIHRMPACSAVVIDDFAGGYTAATHLLELGHRHLLCFYHDIESVPRTARVAGYRQAMQERGVHPDDYLHQSFWKYSQPELSAQELRNTLQQYPEITAIMAPNDRSTVLMRDMLKREGKSVPDEMSLIGFDDTDPLPDEYGRNILTTVAVPLEELGRTAARMLIQQIAQRTEELETCVLPVSLVVRGSTAAIRE